MEFHEKLQELRKQKGMTQEELAERLYVSRTAISKWESGRGYPNIDSLKAIAAFFSITVDELLSTDEVLTIAEETQTRREKQFCDLVFGLVDICALLLLFLPLFASKADGVIRASSLLLLEGVSLYIRILYFAFIIALIVIGALTLALQSYQARAWNKIKTVVSLAISACLVLLFTVSLQPYAAVFGFVFMLIKTFVLIKRK